MPKLPPELLPMKAVLPWILLLLSHPSSLFCRTCAPLTRFSWLWMAGLRLGSIGKPLAGPPPTSPFLAGLRHRPWRNSPGTFPVAAAPAAAHQACAPLRKRSARPICPRQRIPSRKNRRMRYGSAVSAVTAVVPETRNTAALHEKTARTSTATTVQAATLQRHLCEWKQRRHQQPRERQLQGKRRQQGGGRKKRNKPQGNLCPQLVLVLVLLVAQRQLPAAYVLTIPPLRRAAQTYPILHLRP